MTNSFKHISLFSMVVVTALTAAQASAQAPTDAQRSAIKSSCRSDYISHCSSVTPGGAEALHCLQKNMSGLSSACQSAVRAVTAATEPKSETKPAATEAGKPAEAAPAQSATDTAAPTEPAKPAAAASKPASSAAAMPAGKPSKAQVAAIRSACRSDYANVCAGVPTGGAAALQCLEKNKAKLSATCEKAVAAASGGAVAPATAAAAPAAGGAPAAAAAPVLVLRPLRPLEELRIVNAACGPDARALCSAVQPGGGRIARCLATNAASLSPACRSMLAEFAAR